MNDHPTYAPTQRRLDQCAVKITHLEAVSRVSGPTAAGAQALLDRATKLSDDVNDRWGDDEYGPRHADLVRALLINELAHADPTDSDQLAAIQVAAAAFYDTASLAGAAND